MARKNDVELAQAIAELKRRQSRDACEQSLFEFLKQGWRYIDPNPFVGGWHLQAIAEHLQAVAYGGIKRLCINVPPRSSKSSLSSVAFPAWVWAQKQDSPLSGPYVQFLFASYAQSLSMRDSLKTRRLIESPFYQDRWRDRFAITSDQNTKIRFENDKGGYRLATSVGGSLTGEGGSILLVDDCLSADQARSEAERENALSWWDSSMSTRLNDPKTGAMIVIMQRLHQDDLTGHILSKDEGEWTHLMLPMRYEPMRHCQTFVYDQLFWEDPRTEDGELLCPDRFGEREVGLLERQLASDAAGQLQQRPVPKGGAIIKEEYWQEFNEEVARRNDVDPGHLPPFEYVVASFDGAFGEKEENDYSACTVWGLWLETLYNPMTRNHEPGNPKILLINAWRGRLPLHGKWIEEKQPWESPEEYRARCIDNWGVVERLADTCKKYKVDKLLIESKATGMSVYQEIRRLFGEAAWGMQLDNPGNLDKVARAHMTVSLFADRVVYAPVKEGEFVDYADMVISECSYFPKGSHDDLVDTTTAALNFFRRSGLALRAEEDRDIRQEALIPSRPARRDRTLGYFR